MSMISRFGYRCFWEIWKVFLVEFFLGFFFGKVFFFGNFFFGKNFFAKNFFSTKIFFPYHIHTYIHTHTHIHTNTHTHIHTYTSIHLPQKKISNHPTPSPTPDDPYYNLNKKCLEKPNRLFKNRPDEI